MDKNYVFQHYLVAYLDLLGQHDSLRRMSDTPGNKSEEDVFFSIVKESLGKVLYMRKKFSEYFNGVNNSELDLSRFPPEHHESIKAASKNECAIYGLSDATVITVPLSTDYEWCKTMSGVQATFLGICALAIDTFAKGIVFRGGLDIGIASLLDKNEIYGSAFVRAYDLEHEFAEYPRIIIGSKLLQIIDDLCKNNPQSDFGNVAKKKAERCKKMIIQDTDGRQMLDFLGTETKNTFKKSISADHVSDGNDFVFGEYKKFHKMGNEKLASRYYRLLQYYLARKKIWDL